MIQPEQIAKAVELAKAQLGKPYAIGGEDQNGKWVVRGKPNISNLNPTDFDCSGFSRWVVGQCGLVIPHGCAEQIKYCKPLGPTGKDLPLDLGFAALHRSDGIPDHVVIWLDGENVIEARAPQEGKDYGKVIERPKAKWLAQKGFLGVYRVPGVYA